MTYNEKDEKELLQYAVENGMINLSYVQEQVEMNKKKELLDKHPYKIWKGKDGKWYTYLPDKDKGRVLKKKTSRADIEEDVESYWRTEMENPTISEVFDEWNDRRLALKKISNATHLRNKQLFDRHYKEFGGKRIKNINEEEFSEFLEEQIPKYDLTAKAFSNLKTITRGFLKRAKRRRLISFNVEGLFQELDTSDTDFRKTIKEDYQEVFNEVETPIVMSYLIDNLDDKNLGILLMFVTGIRVGELVALKHEDFDGNTFVIRRTETKYAIEKGRYKYDIKDFPKTQCGVRTVIIPESYAWISSKIKNLNPESEYVFLKKDRSRMTTDCIRKRLRVVCKATGIYNKSPHKIRKTYGSILLDNHVDNRLIMGQMGHSDIKCTEGHYHRNRRDIEKKTQILSDIPEFKLG